MKKAVILVVLLVVLSSFSFAVSDTPDTCSGFWGSISCFLWGDASNRAGMGWFDRENVAGGAGTMKNPVVTPTDRIVEIDDIQYLEYYDHANSNYYYKKLSEINLGGDYFLYNYQGKEASKCYPSSCNMPFSYLNYNQASPLTPVVPASAPGQTASEEATTGGMSSTTPPSISVAYNQEQLNQLGITVDKEKGIITLPKKYSDKTLDYASDGKTKYVAIKLNDNNELVIEVTNKDESISTIKYDTITGKKVVSEGDVTGGSPISPPEPNPEPAPTLEQPNVAQPTIIEQPQPQNIKELSSANIYVTSDGKMITWGQEGNKIFNYFVDPITGDLTKNLDYNILLSKAGIVKNGLYVATGEDEAFGIGSKQAHSVKQLRFTSLNQVNKKLTEMNGKYSENQDYIDQLHESGYLTDEEYAEINGDGWFNTEEDMAYVQGLIDDKIVEAEAERDSAELKAQAEQKAKPETNQPAEPASPEPVQPAEPAAPAPASAPSPPPESKPGEWTPELIDKAVACFSNPDCECSDKDCIDPITKLPEKITHSEAYDKYDALAKESEKNFIANAPSGATLTYNGEVYTKDGTDWKFKDKNGNEKTLIPDEVNKLIDQGEITARDSKCDDNADCEKAESLRQSTEALKWQGSWLGGMGGPEYAALVKGEWAGGYLAGGIASLAQSMGSYQPLSNLLFPDATKNWMEIANNEFMNKWADLPGVMADLLGICNYDEARRAESPGQSSAFVQTQSGSYQFVGKIMAEKSASKVPIACSINPDQEAKEQFICKGDQVCKNDGFCYESEESEEPIMGHLYKIDWGVTAPQDESFTPYIDEDGKAVRFNIQLDGRIWVYKRKGASATQVLALENGASDKKLVVKYLPESYTEACIVFDPDYKIYDYYGSSVGDLCADFITISKGTVERTSTPKGESITTASYEVEENI